LDTKEATISEVIRINSSLGITELPEDSAIISIQTGAPAQMNPQLQEESNGRYKELAVV
jgi:hypothetical protein